MLLFRLLSLCITVTLWNFCQGNCHYDSSDLNGKWRAADIVELYGRNFYHSLGLGPDDADDPQKRFVSTYSETLLLYINSEETESNSIKYAARKATERLYRPADVTASDFRAIMSIILSIIEQPLTDVQTACPYDVHESQCIRTLDHLETEKIKRCHHYTRNIHLYDRMREWSTSCGLQRLLNELTTASSIGNEKDAIDFFVRTASKTIPLTYKEFKHIYKMVKRTKFTCNTLTFL